MSAKIPSSSGTLRSEHYFQRPVSETLSTARHICSGGGVADQELADRSIREVIEDHVRFALPRPKSQDGVLRGAVLRVDHFGTY